MNEKSRSNSIGRWERVSSKSIPGTIFTGDADLWETSQLLFLIAKRFNGDLEVSGYTHS